jgi:alpha-mannosidase
MGEFTLMSPARAAAFAGVSAAELAPVRVIEDGPIRTTIEALLECGRSALAVRYIIPAVGTEIEIETRVAWFERDRMLKLAVPTTLDGGEVRTQTAYGVEVVRAQGEETVGHRWLALLSPDGRRALTLVNDTTYGFDVEGGEIRLSLLRAPAYAGHPVDDVTPIVRQDRFEPREDQGEHLFRFWLDAGAARERLDAVDREAAIRTEGLMALCAFPSGASAPALPGVHLSDGGVRLAALKMSEDGQALVLRLFEPTGTPRDTRIRIPALGVEFPLTLGPFELRTLLVDLATRAVSRADLLERPEVAP